VSLIPEWLNPLNWISSVVQAIVSGLSSFIQWLVSGLSWIASQVWNFLSSIANSFVQSILGFINQIVIAPVTGFVNSLIQAIQKKLFGIVYIAITVPLMIQEIKKLVHKPSFKELGLLFIKPILTYLAVTVLFSFLQGIAPVGAVPSLPPPSVPPITPVPGAPPSAPPSVPGAPAPTAPVLTDTLALSDTAGVWLSASPVSMDILSLGDSISLTVTNPQTGSSTTITQTTEGGSSTSPSSSSSSTTSSGETPSNILPWAEWVDLWGWYISYVDAIEGNRLLASTFTDELALTDLVSFPVGHRISESWLDSFAPQDTVTVTTVPKGQTKSISIIDSFAVTDMGASLSKTPWATVSITPLDTLNIQDTATPYFRASIESYLDSVSLTDTVSVTAQAPITPADPTYPAYAPSGGWDKVFQFNDPSELNDPAIFYDETTVSNGMAIVTDNGAFGVDYCCSAPVPTYGATRFRIPSWPGLNPDVTDWWIIEFNPRYCNPDGSTYEYHVVMGVDSDHPNSFYFQDVNGGAKYYIPITSDWLVVVTDFKNAQVKVFDSKGNLILTLSNLGTRLVGFKNYWEYYILYNPSNTATPGYDIDVDWIAVKY